MKAAVPVPTIGRGLDRLIETVAPSWALQRRRARAGLALTAGFGGYDGASRVRPETQQWRTRALSPNDALLPDLALLRERCQDAVRNNPIARGAIAGVVTSVVGTGLQARPRLDRLALGMTDAEAKAWQAAALREWNAWAYSQECDLARTLTFDEIQRVAFRSVLVDGDHFVAKRFRERAGSVFGLKAQLVTSARVCNPQNAADSATLRAGIEFDPETGEPLVYHVASGDPTERLRLGGKLAWTPLPAFGPQSGQRQMLHLMRPLEAGVLRGEPYLAPVLKVLRQTGTYTDAELMAAVVNSCFAVTTKTVDAEGLDQAASGKTDEKGDPVVLAKAGTIVDLAAGETVESFTPGRPSAAFDPFMQAMLRQIGMALELPLEVLIKHFESSYSASRGALLEAWRFYRGHREWLSWALCQPFYEAVLTEAIARGRLAAPGFFADPMVRAAWTGCEWYGQAPGSLDPLKEVEAFGKAVAYRFTTRERATIELNGGDYQANLEQLVREQQDAIAGGLAADPTTTVTDPNAPTNQVDTTDPAKA